MIAAHPQSAEWLGLAERAARAGASALLPTSAPVVLSEGGRDVKLDVDLRAEELILAALRESSDFPILTEERGEIAGRSTDDDLKWIVDPLDGSFNHVRRIPFCCVSIALWRGDAPLLGTVYDFNRDEMFSGVVGRGASVNGAPIRVTNVPARSHAALATGFPVGADFRPDALHAFVDDVRRYKKIRLLGSAALSLAYVAAGRMDAYGEEGIRLWDVAAGLALVQAAGGTLSYSTASAIHPMRVYADNGRLETQGAQRG